MYKICLKCKVNNEDYVEFCTNCGKKFPDRIIETKKPLEFKRVDDTELETDTPIGPILSENRNSNDSHHGILCLKRRIKIKARI